MAKRHSAEEVVNKLRQVDVEVSKGGTIVGACKLIGMPSHYPQAQISPPTRGAGVWNDLRNAAPFGRRSSCGIHSLW